MWNPDMTPRPMVVAYNTFARLLRGKTFVRKAELSPIRHSYAFRGKGDFSGRGDQDWVLAHWRRDNIVHQGAVLIKVDAGAVVTQVDHMENRTPLQVQDNVVVLPSVFEETRYVLLDGSSDFTPLGDAAAFPEHLAVMAGSNNEIKAKVANPYQSPLTISATWNKGKNFSATTRPVTLQPGENAELPVTVATDSSFVGDFMIGTIEFSGAINTSFSQHVRLNWQRPLSTEKPENRKPDFVIERQDQVHNCATFHLTLRGQDWTGPDDNSAKIWAWVEDEAICLQVDVTDDQPGQTVPGGDQWQGDNIQVCIAVPSAKGWFEIGCNSGEKDKVHCWVAPAGMKRGEAAKRIAGHVADKEKGAVYTLRVPLDLLGTDRAKLTAEGIRLNVAVNDRDEHGIRASGMEISFGIIVRKDILAWPLLKLIEAK